MLRCLPFLNQDVVTRDSLIYLHYGVVCKQERDANNHFARRPAVYLLVNVAETCLSVVLKRDLWICICRHSLVCMLVYRTHAHMCARVQTGMSQTVVVNPNSFFACLLVMSKLMHCEGMCAKSMWMNKRSIFSCVCVMEMWWCTRLWISVWHVQCGDEPCVWVASAVTTCCLMHAFYAWW